MIQNIEISKLHFHPNNPRKDLGDLSELIESIKSQGVLQNLTVVPWFSTITGVGCDNPKQQEESGYYVVIGNRRLAAARQAGLTELPCVISDMDYKTQIGTMLLENMQREDLTIYEQAQGFQMMLDLGETVSDIAELTGFSNTTVKRRIELTKLDPEKFKASAERNVNIMEYVELEKIENIELRNKVLESIGTQNFKYELQRAIDKEKSEKDLAAIVEQLNKFASEVKDSNGLRYIKTYYLSMKDEVTVPDDAGEAKYFYYISTYGSITLYGEAVEFEEDTAANEQRELQRAKYNSLEEISKRAFDIRYKFVRGISNTKAKKNIGAIIEYSIRSMLESYVNLELEDIYKLINISMPESEDEEDDNDDECWTDDIAARINQEPERYMLIATYCMSDSSSQNYYNWRGSYIENKNLDRIYDLLETFGYEISDEEKAMRDGTHELFGEVDR